MNKNNYLVERVKIGLVVGLLAVLSGCATYGGEGYYDDTVIVSEPGPDLYLFGGPFYGRREAHNYSHRGSESRRIAAPSGGRSSSTVRSGVERGGRR